MLTINAFAKVNFTLEVLGQRKNGYHDIASIMQTIDLSDTVTLEQSDSISLNSDSSDLQSSNNLALKSAVLMQKTTGCTEGVTISLKKRIPIAAGLGGGSSDAAATLTGLNKLWNLDMSISDLTSLAIQIGADVPFFLHGGTAMVHGLGEHVRTLPTTDLQWMVVLVPSIRIPEKTRSMYGNLSEHHFSKGALTRKLEARIRGGGSLPPQYLFNTFDSIALETFPGLKNYWDTFYSLGASEIHLAGSGPALFCPISRKESGETMRLLLRHQYQWNAHLVSTCPTSHKS